MPEMPDEQPDLIRVLGAYGGPLNWPRLLWGSSLTPHDSILPNGTYELVHALDPEILDARIGDLTATSATPLNVVLVSGDRLIVSLMCLRGRRSLAPLIMHC